MFMFFFWCAIGLLSGAIFGSLFEWVLHCYSKVSFVQVQGPPVPNVQPKMKTHFGATAVVASA